MGYKYQLAHRSEKGIQRGSFQDVFADFHKGERWLLISPHDDDIAVGFGMGLGIAVDEAVNVRVRIVTNGGMGYTSVVDEEHIQAVRRRETKKSFDYLGVRDFDWYGYPDGGLTPHLGRRSVKMPGPGAPHEVEGHTGLQNSIVAELRDFRPTRLFLLSAMDYHTDHKLVHQETLISLFHAYGDIWPELGSPLQASSVTIYEMAVYCPFMTPPDFQITAEDAVFQRKLNAISAFRSQTQIEHLVAAVQNAGAMEYLRTLPFSFFDPNMYKSYFED